jgi:hypothetical protein
VAKGSAVGVGGTGEGVRVGVAGLGVGEAVGRIGVFASWGDGAGPAVATGIGKFIVAEGSLTGVEFAAGSSGVVAATSVPEALWQAAKRSKVTSQPIIILI